MHRSHLSALTLACLLGSYCAPHLAAQDREEPPKPDRENRRRGIAMPFGGDRDMQGMDRFHARWKEQQRQLKERYERSMGVEGIAELAKGLNVTDRAALLSAVAAWQADRHERAMDGTRKIAEAAAEPAPDAASVARLLLGRMQHAQEKIEEARGTWRTVTGRAAVQALLNLTYPHLTTGHAEEAVRAYTELLAVQPTDLDKARLARAMTDLVDAPVAQLEPPARARMLDAVAGSMDRATALKVQAALEAEPPSYVIQEKERPPFPPPPPMGPLGPPPHGEMGGERMGPPAGRPMPMDGDRDQRRAQMMEKRRDELTRQMAKIDEALGQKRAQGLKDDHPEVLDLNRFKEDLTDQLKMLHNGMGGRERPRPDNQRRDQEMREEGGQAEAGEADDNF